MADRLVLLLRNERSTTGGFPCPLSRSLPAIPAAQGRERNIKRTVIDRLFLARGLPGRRSLANLGRAATSPDRLFDVFYFAR